MIVYRLRQDQKDGNLHVAGATLGELHLEPLRATLQRSAAVVEAAGLGEIVVLDFAGIESATASYVKATVIGLLRAGAASAGARPADGAPVALNIFPVMKGLNDELRAELRDVAEAQEVPWLEVVELRADGIARARLYGPLDRALRDTLEIVTRRTRATATMLHADHPRTPPISITAWNNRLSDLHARRLLRRERDGRQWTYLPLADEVTYG
jgi:hypothetical protein